jgi:dTDP-4-amino-4,6-dideoxygalactose transaminase
MADSSKAVRGRSTVPAGSEDHPIFVTRPLLPPLEEFLPYLENIWSSGILTNSGPYHAQLEDALRKYLGVEHISLFCNGTLALLTAIQALRISGEVITTPYSFVATSHSLLWNGIKPVFVDIQPDSLNLDPGRIQAAITPRTTAIMPVHCYGRPCDVAQIERIADDYGLKVVYDAAHAFGVRRQGRSILSHGDMSVLSFHATKVFTTFEGGAVVCPDAKTKQRLDRLKNFGYVDETTVVAPGINGKMNEIQAACGLLQLKHIDRALARRAEITRTYREHLASIQGITCLTAADDTEHNFAYFPILVDRPYPRTRDELYTHLRSLGIVARRYFYPLISDFPMYRELPSAARANLPVATQAAERVLCLPIYPALTDADQQRVIRAIASLRDR